MSATAPAAIAADGALQPRDLRTPVGNGATLIDPPLDAAASLLAANQRRLAAGCQVRGRALSHLRAAAQADLRVAAAAATAEYAAPPSIPATGPIVLAGHQPNLFHAGVWAKNIVLSRLAEWHAGAAINLQIDGDAIKSPAIRVPGGSLSQPTAEPVEFDAPAAEMPWEERRVLDASLFDSFAARAAAVIRPFVANPLVADLWPRAVARRVAGARLGTALAQARHQWELTLGLRTAELPHSHVYQFEAQRWMLADLLARAPSFREVHNQALHEYRRRYGVRSANHPVSDLAANADWIETPCWVWSSEFPQRRRLFVRQRGPVLELTDRVRWTAELPLSADSPTDDALAGLGQLEAAGVKIRTRALLTTLLARLILADVFIHGIGGGKYDRLTDVLVRRFYGLEPPEFLVVSATLHLPIPRAAVTETQAARVDHELRELTYHPERSLDALPASPVGPALAAEKRRWVEQIPTRDTARLRTHAIRRLNESLAAIAAPRRDALLAERESLRHRLRAEAVLASREYAFCLFPEQELRHFMLEISPARP